MRFIDEFFPRIVHNKLKEKLGVLPEGMPYFSGEDVPDKWCKVPFTLLPHAELIYFIFCRAVDYPWEQT